MAVGDFAPQLAAVVLKVPEIYNQTFEPVFNPAIGAAAIAAAIPPIIFWVRVVAAEQRRQKEAEDKERAREVSAVFG